MRIIIDVADNIPVTVVSLCLQQAASAINHGCVEDFANQHEIVIGGTVVGQWCVSEKHRKSELQRLEANLTTEEKVALEMSRPGLFERIKNIITNKA